MKDEELNRNLSKIGLLISQFSFVRQVEWYFQDNRILPATIFSPDGGLGIFVQMSEWETRYHDWKNIPDFTVETGDTLCGLSVVPRSDIERPCYFGLMSSVVDVLHGILLKKPVSRVRLEELANMPEDDAVPLFKFSWP